jgi:hypothetical protein
LRLATAVIDVHPPRAQPWVKRLRRVLPMRRRLGPRPAAPAATSHVALVIRRLRLPVIDWQILVRCVVPGWAHFYTGLAQRGRIFLCTYLASLGLGLLFLGTTLGSIFLGLMFAAHASSVLDILLHCPGGHPSRVATTFLVMAVLVGVLYLPTGWLLPPQVGHVVLYESPAVSLQGLYIMPGEAIDRILARPGDRFRWDGGKAYVNDALSPWQPLNPADVPAGLKIIVPPGTYLILPSTRHVAVPRNLVYQTTPTWERLALVPAGRIEGKVVMRLHPLTRFWWIR